MAKKKIAAPRARKKVAPKRKTAAKKSPAKKASTKKAAAKKASAKKSASKRAAKAEAKAADHGGVLAIDEAAAATTEHVVARMFCHGLGDCFLISIPQADTVRPYWIMIDCGIAKNTPDEPEKMQAVAETIAHLTEGKVDLLVVTHEHWDHVCGFGHAEEVFRDKIAFAHLWYAWTEDPEDKVADELRAKKKKAQVALQHAFARLSRLEAKPQSVLDGIDGILAYFGLGAAANGGGRLTIAKAMDLSRELVASKGGKVHYLMPGEIRGLPDPAGGPGASGGAGGVRAYVLGPPHSAKQVRKTNPSKKHPETYHKEGEAGGHLAFAGLGAALDNAPWLRAAFEAGDNGGRCEEAFDPFDRQWWIDEPEQHPFFERHYFKGDEAMQHRRIDGDWLQGEAQRLALHLDAYTNNTSLVLAFELPASKKVLLFVGDAQVGSWLSWHDLEFHEGSRTVDIADLFARSVLYKVGHHGSHNATLRQQGLEMMTNRELTALVPVEDAAVKRLRYGEMPLKSLMEALGHACHKRVFRSDEIKGQNDAKKGKWGDRKTPRVVRCVGGDSAPVYLEVFIEDQA